MTYFITFSCYGAHLHGEECGSVDKQHNLYGGRLVDTSPVRVEMKRRQMDQTSYFLDQGRRAAVLIAVRHVCLSRNWNLLAAHIRTNHVHVFVGAETRPEPIMNAFKSYASRELNRLGLDPPNRKRWARHGSTRWLWNDDDIRGAIHYVVYEQGEPMEVYLNEST